MVLSPLMATSNQCRAGIKRVWGKSSQQLIALPNGKTYSNFYFYFLEWNASGIMDLRNGWSFKKMEWPQYSEEKNWK
jgi:hypothetical protein